MELSFESVLSVVPKTKSSAVNEEEAALVVFFADGYREIKAKELIKEILIHKPVCCFYVTSVCRGILNSLPFVLIILLFECSFFSSRAFGVQESNLKLGFQVPRRLLELNA